MAKPTVQIDVVSDIVCPWCFLGKKRLDKALQKLEGQADFQIRWLPYMLNPSASEEGINKLQFYNDKFGPGRVAEMIPAMAANFREEGVEYSLGGLTGTTRNAHRLLLWARDAAGADVQAKLMERIMLGYFAQERFPNDAAFLAEAAEAVGLPRAEAEAVISDPTAWGAQLQAALRTYPGISGVPHFVINGRHHLSGAQPPDVLAQEVRAAIAAQ